LDFHLWLPYTDSPPRLDLSSWALATSVDTVHFPASSEKEKVQQKSEIMSRN
jgi:hypothetical protein